MEKRKGYKKTMFGWIPEEWGIDCLSSVTSYVDYRGKTPLKSNDGVFLVTAKNIKNGKINYKISQEFIPKETYNEVMKRGLPIIGDIIITTEAPLGEVAEIDEENVALAQRVIKLRGNDRRLINRFLKYFLMSDKFQNFLKLDATGSTIKGIKGSRLKKLLICLPPLPEQRKIASIFSTVDEKIESIDQQLEAAEQLKKGLMQQLLTKGIGHTEFKETKIGKIPKKWEIVRLGEVSSKITDGVHSTPKYTERGIPFLSVSNLQNNKISFIDCKFIPVELHKELIKRCKPEVGDILMGKVASIGICDVVDTDEEFSIFVQVALIKPLKEKIYSYFLKYSILEERFQKAIYSNAAGTTMKYIGIERISKLEIPLPPLEEQIRVAKILNTVDEKLDILREKRDQYQTLKKGLMQKLLTGEIRVHLNKKENEH